MKHATSAIAAIIAAAGFAGAVQAQSMTPPGTPPSQNTQTNQYTAQTPSSPNGAQYNPSAAQRPATTAPQSNAQWNAAQRQNAMQNPRAEPSGNQVTGYQPFWSHHISKNTVREAQQRLAAEGLYRGREDGLMGTQTERAISEFQQRNGLPVTGTLDQATLARLAGPSNQGYGSAGQPAGAASMNPTPTSPPQMNGAPATAGGYPTSGAGATATPAYGSHAQPR